MRHLPSTQDVTPTHLVISGKRKCHFSLPFCFLDCPKHPRSPSASGETSATSSPLFGRITPVSNLRLMASDVTGTFQSRRRTHQSSRRVFVDSAISDYVQGGPGGGSFSTGFDRFETRRSVAVTFPMVRVRFQRV